MVTFLKHLLLIQRAFSMNSLLNSDSIHFSISFLECDSIFLMNNLFSYSFFFILFSGSCKITILLSNKFKLVDRKISAANNAASLECFVQSGVFSPMICKSNHFIISSFHNTDAAFSIYRTSVGHSTNITGFLDSVICF